MRDRPLILIADGDDVGSRRLEALLQDQKYELSLVNDANEAMALFEAQDPDLVLLIADSPDGDGCNIARGIGRSERPFKPPVLFIADESERDSIAECAEAGGCDFIFIPLVPEVLYSRLETYLQLSAANRRRQESQSELNYYRALLDREKVVAQSIFDNVLHRDVLRQENIRYRLSPSSVFNGNLILAAMSPSDNLHLLVGDFSGYGLSASIGSLPTAEIFYAMTAKGFEPVDIVAEINKRLRTLFPVDVFLAACFVEIDATGKTANIWNGGLPDLLLNRAASGKVQRIVSRHTPLAILDDGEFDRTLDMVALDPEDRFYIFTDSVPDILSDEGELFGMERLIDYFESAEASTAFDNLIGRLSAHTGEDLDSDAVTFLEYRAIPQEEEEAQSEASAKACGNGISIDWSFEMKLNPEALRRFDPRPMLTQLMVDIQGLSEHRQRLYTIIAELFSNAVEHGLIGLDSQLKATPEGFAQYYVERERRLSELAEGTVDFRLFHRPTGDGGILTIEVEDSGPGFDFEKRGSGELPMNGFCGRGIGLMRQMSEKVSYFSPGNRVQVSYHWVKSTD
jgi:two-component system, HptB-dependent secretion and biofilm response regulator